MQLRNPFQILGLPQTLELSSDQVQSAFLQGMATLHPDIAGLGQSDADDFDEARTVRAAELNLAREQLLDEASRAEALLQLRGGPTLTHDKSLPDGFLMMMIEAREELDAARERSDTEATAASLAWARQQRRACLDRLASVLASDDLGRARTELNACRYIDRMIEHVQREAS